MKRKMIRPPSGEPPVAGVTVPVGRGLALDVAKYLAAQAREIRASYFAPSTRKWDRPEHEHEYKQVRDWVLQLREAAL